MGIFSKYIKKGSNEPIVFNKFLAICDKPSQIPQLIALSKIIPEFMLDYKGSNLTIVVLDTLGNNHNAKAHLENELLEYDLGKVNVIHYENNSLIYKGNYGTDAGIKEITNSIRSIIGDKFEGIFCSLISQRFVKIHLDTYANASIYLLEDGLGSYLELSTKLCNKLVDNYVHSGNVLSHTKRIKKVGLIHKDLGIPNMYKNIRYLNIDVENKNITELKKIENTFTSLKDKELNILTNELIRYWKNKNTSLKKEYQAPAVLIGQNLSDFSNNFYFRDEVDLYIETCERLLNKFEKIIFAPHPKISKRLIEIMKSRLSNPERVIFFEQDGIPVESLFLGENPAKYAFGYYSSAMWNIKNIISNENVFCVLGWDTLNLYQNLRIDIQKQAYRKARITFYPIEKFERGL